MNRLRTASFLLAAASLGSLAAATARHLIPAVLASAAVLALSCASWAFLGPWERRRRIAEMGEAYAVVMGMTAGGVVRKVRVRWAELDGSDEGDVAA